MSATETQSDPKLEIAHVLTMDIVRYSILLIHQQSQVLTILNEAARNSDCFRAADAAHRLIPLPTGDGMALVFSGDPEAPLECAMQIASELKQHPEIALRMGIHSGPISQIVDVNGRINVAGAGIDMAQRVMDCGDAGHILVSKRVADDLAPYPRWNSHLHDLGDCEVKHGRRVGLFNFYTGTIGNSTAPAKLQEQRKGEPSRELLTRRSLRWKRSITAGVVLCILAAGVFAWWWFAAGAANPVGPKSLAVLPFATRGEDQNNGYLADSIQDEILTRLYKVGGIKVISRTSTQIYRTGPHNLPAIAQELRVAYIVEGSVQKIGDAIRVNVQLIEGATDSHLWADTFDYTVADLFRAEADVAKAIVTQLKARLTGSEAVAIATQSTSNPEAYRAYLRGKAYSIAATTSPGNLAEAQRYLREAVRLDSSFAGAWALLSYVDAVGFITLTLQPTESLREESRLAAERAIKLQPKLGEAVWAKGYYHYACLRDYDTALSYFEEASQLLPNSSRIPESLAYVARRQGHWDRAESYFNEAERLDPRNPVILTEHGLFYFARRQFSKAARKLDDVLDITPTDIQVMAAKAAVAQANGDLAEATRLTNGLRPTVSDVGVIETQIYQKLLERRAGEILPMLRNLLKEPDVALGYYNDELRFWFGWAAHESGDPEGAAASWREARAGLESFFQQQPENYALLGDLALTCMALGDNAAAFDFAQRAIAANPTARDAIAGPGALEILARVSAQMGEHEQAINILEKLLAIPYAGPLATQNSPLTPALLRLDPMFDPLRANLRFQKLIGATDGE